MLYRKTLRNNLAKPGNMINDRTVTPSSGPVGKQASLAAAPYFGVRVDTTDASLTDDTYRVVLFDSSAGYQLEQNFFMDPAISITGIGSTYDFILNDTSHHGRYISMIKMTVLNASDAGIDNGGGQFSFPLNVYQTVVGRGPSLVDTLYPDMGVHEGQFQTYINTFEAGITFTNQIALVVDIKSGTKVDFAFYQGAELGRKQ